MRRFDGEYRWFSCFAQSHYATIRKHCQMVWHQYRYRDRSDRRRAAAKRGLSAEAQRLSHTGSFGCTSQRRNHLSAEATEYSSTTPTTRPRSNACLNRVHPDDAELVRQVIERATAHKEPLILSIGC